MNILEEVRVLVKTYRKKKQTGLSKYIAGKIVKSTMHVFVILLSKGTYLQSKLILYPCLKAEIIQFERHNKGWQEKDYLVIYVTVVIIKSLYLYQECFLNNRYQPLISDRTTKDEHLP